MDSDIFSRGDRTIVWYLLMTLDYPRNGITEFYGQTSTRKRKKNHQRTHQVRERKRRRRRGKGEREKDKKNRTASKKAEEKAGNMSNSYAIFPSFSLPSNTMMEENSAHMHARTTRCVCEIGTHTHTSYQTNLFKYSKEKSLPLVVVNWCWSTRKKIGRKMNDKSLRAVSYAHERRIRWKRHQWNLIWIMNILRGCTKRSRLPCRSIEKWPSDQVRRIRKMLLAGKRERETRSTTTLSC